MKIQESAENYLEAILVLTQKNGQVRSIDVAHYTGFSKPSISRAMSVLRQDGAITMDAYGSIQLTEKGLHIAASLYERHQFCPAFLPPSASALMLPPPTHAALSTSSVRKPSTGSRNSPPI